MGESVLTASRPVLARIADAVGTPTYVYDAGVVRDRYRALTEAMGATPHRVFYSVKANGNLAILGVLRSLGAGADIVSVGELVRARRAGFTPADIVFSGVGKRRDELETAVRQRVGLINVESAAELRLVSELAAAHGRVARVGIRVNPDVTTHTHPYTQTGHEGMKFGVPWDEVASLAEFAAAQSSLSLDCVGMHIGSQIVDAEHYRSGAERLGWLVAELRRRGVRSLRLVDVGGGLGIRYLGGRGMDADTFAAAVRPLADATGLPLLLEPGRFLVGPAGVLLTRCLYRKCSGGRDFVIVDAGMNDLLRPSLYGAEHEIGVIGEEGAAEAAEDGPHQGAVEPADIVGPLCESGDFLARARVVSGATPGALLGVFGAGAYGFSMSSTYNSRPRAAEVLLEGDRWAVARARERLDDLMQGERTLGAITDWTTERDG